MYRDFSTIMKDVTVSSVHTPTAIGNEYPKRKGKYRDFKAIIAEVSATGGMAKGGHVHVHYRPNLADCGHGDMLKWLHRQLKKRELQPNGETGTAKSPFRYDPNALGSLRPDQVPRFFGALTDPKDLDTKEVQLDDLHATQDRVDPDKVQAIREHGTKGKKAVVVQHNGKQYIADGHHRLTADWLDGKDTAVVAFKDLEPVDHALKRQPEPAANDAVGPSLMFKAAAVDDQMGIVHGWAVVCKVNGEDYYDLNIDHDGPHAGQRVPEHVTEAAMAKAALEFAKLGAPGNEMHEGPDVGTFPFICPMTTELYKALFGTDAIPPKTGLYVGYEPPANVLAKFKSKEYSGFSIEGRRLSYEEHPNGN